MKREKAQKSVSKLKLRLDVLVSKYVRLTGDNHCYTCGKVGGFKTLQCGHYIHRRITATRWDLDNLRVQDVGCNYFGNQQHIFGEKLRKELGPERWDALHERARHTKPFIAKQIEEMIEEYKKKLEELT